MKIKRSPPEQELPDSAKKVFEGVIYDVYHWPQEMYDGSIATFEQLKRPDSIGVIPVTQEGKIILQKQKQPGHRDYFYSTPGGRLEEGEEPEECALRELKEETGYNAEKVILWEVNQIIPHVDSARYTFIGIDCSIISEQNLDSGEKINLEFVNFESFKDAVFSSRFRDFSTTLLLARALHNANEHKRFLELLGWEEK
jgi:8-oxo-dGTP pyrophosphatase MutT (NUDIX family)